MNAVVKETPEPEFKPASYAADDGFVILPSGQFELCASKGDVLYYLNWPYLDLADPDKPVFVATNGHVLVVTPVKIEGKVSQGPVPVEAIKKARTAKSRKPGEPRLTFLGDMVGTGDVMFRRPKDVRFPNWRKILSDNEVDTSEDPDIAFRGEYLQVVEKALGKSKYGGVKLYFGVDDEGHVDPAKPTVIKSISSDGSDAIGVVMPMRW